MKVFGIRCPDCNDIIYSRAQHDFIRCDCGSCYVDGGFEYFRCGGEKLNKIERMQINLKDATKSILYDCWNNSEGEYTGHYKDEDFVSLGKLLDNDAEQSSWAARQIHVLEVDGSNPSSATKFYAPVAQQKRAQNS